MINNIKQERARKIIIKSLEIYNPTTLSSKDSNTIQIPNKNINNYYKIDNENIDISNYTHFPLLLNKDSSLWEVANRYLLFKLHKYKKPKQKTIDGIANDLISFRRFCDDENINYLDAPKKIQRPTWLYRNYLNDLLEKGKLSPSTLKKKMLTITLFYDWLIKHEGIKFKFKLWNSSEVFIRYKDSYGQEQIKIVQTKDVNQIHYTNNKDTFANEIIDGGKLRPLTVSQQQILFESLNDLGNTEMTLSFLLSLSTGARIQTVFTLRLKHFSRVPDEDEKEIKIAVGPGTGADTKYSKNFLLYIPRFVYMKIQVYIKSQRASTRRNKAKHIFEDNLFQYIFLTNRGTPYYASLADPNREDYTSPPDGATVRTFIATQLSKKIKLSKNNFQFNYHNLRATYGINYIKFNKPLVQAGVISEFKLLANLQQRMAHSNQDTTKSYIKYEVKNKEVRKAQDSYEKHLRLILANKGN